MGGDMTMSEGYTLECLSVVRGWGGFNWAR